MIADIHIHPNMKPFNSGFPDPDLQKNMFDNYDNPCEIAILHKLAELMQMGVIFNSQSNMERMHRGGVRVVCISLYPVEKGFTNVDLAAISPIIKALLSPFNIEEKLVEGVTGIKIEKVHYIGKELTDYFKELVKEYEYVLSQSKTSHGPVKCRFVKNYAEMKNILETESDTICMINSIEGAHSFGSGTAAEDHLPLADLKTRFTGNIKTAKQWEYPPFFVSLNHHFWNHLGGHARSLSSFLGKVMSQEAHINEGLTEAGKHAIRELLSTANGKRILIDVKHMSAKCRKEYYELLKTEFAVQNIPIICSHTGIIEQRETLNRVIAENVDTDNSNDGTYLHNWSINICREDFETIYNSKGLIGIQLDEKRMGGGIAKHKINDKRKLCGNGDTNSQAYADYKKEYLQVLMANIFEVVRKIKNKSAWDIVCIGSDMDGIINPMDIYSDCSTMESLKQDVIQFLKTKTPIEDVNLKPEFIKTYMYGFTPEEIADKIFFKNVDDFLKRNFV
jgi:microsomal dipeptidase-like Zn-dependent dipeptidase